MLHIDPDNTIEQRLADLGDIAACSSRLSSGEKVGMLFPIPHYEERFHLVVRILVPPSLGE
jgi:hypothetical protein